MYAISVASHVQGATTALEYSVATTTWVELFCRGDLNYWSLAHGRFYCGVS
jgi:hypothetical protein